MLISSRFTDKDWALAFHDGEKWDVAITIAEDRIKSRWLGPATKLIKLQGAGFAIVALDCIVLESLWGFMNGSNVKKGKENAIYREMLTDKPFEWETVDTESFRRFVRNGLMHDAETRNRWLIEKTIPTDRILEKRGSAFILNRTKFHEGVVATVESWVSRLRDDQEVVLRTNLRRRMDCIVKVHKGDPTELGSP